ncbi:hypothetical protein Tco_0642266, partial [Tanacetum coccineum]
MSKTNTGIGLSMTSDGTRNNVVPVGDKSTVMKGVTLSMIDMNVNKEKLSSLEDTVLVSFPSLPMQVTTSTGNAPGKSSYANITGKPSGKKVNVRTLYTPGGTLGGKYGLVRSMFSSSTGLFSFQFSSMDGLDAMLKNVWVKLHGVPVTAFSKDGLSAIATKLANVELKDNIFVAMPKMTREGYYTCNVRVEYERKPPRCSSCKVFGHVHEECTKNTGAGEKKTLKKPSQTSRGVSVGPKIGFKPQKEYRHVLKKPNVSSSGNKEKGVEPTIDVSNSNSFDVLNSVNNDVEFGTNGGTTNFVNNGATSSRSSFMNIDNDGEFASNTPISEKID